MPISKNNKTILIAGATGYIGSHVVKKLTRLRYKTICLTRDKKLKENKSLEVFNVDLTNALEMKEIVNTLPKIDVIISCIGSYTGGIKDSWNVEYNANKNLLDLGLYFSINQFILLSAICVQKPKLEFQWAKIAFEKLLINSGITYSIVRPTAFFKSLSGQLKNVKLGKKFIYFDNGVNTSCKPISENDLAQYICKCILSKDKLNKILPIGGPGPALTPLQTGNLLFNLVGQTPNFKRVPSKLFTILAICLIPLAFFSKRIADAQQFLRIANYYATESMLVYNHETSSYDETLTPEFGTDTLENHFKKLLAADHEINELGAHKLF